MGITIAITIIIIIITIFVSTQTRAISIVPYSAVLVIIPWQGRCLGLALMIRGLPIDTEVAALVLVVAVFEVNTSTEPIVVVKLRVAHIAVLIQ